MIARQELAASVLTDLLFEEPGVGRCLVAPDGNVLRANAEWLRSTGFRLDDVLGADIIELFPETRDMALAMHARARTGQRVSVPRHAQVVNGRETWWEGSIAPVPMDGGFGLLITACEATPQYVALPEPAAFVIARDDSARTRAEQALRESEVRWRGVIEGIADEVWLCDASGRMSLINLPDVTAMGLEEFEGKTYAELLENLDILRADGRPRPPEEAPLLRSVRTGEIVRGEEMMRDRRTGKIRYRQFSCAPVRDDSRAISGAVAIVRDITAYKETQDALHDANEKLREADRRKDEFLGMLSHELRNPLAPIRNSIYILRNTQPGSEQATRAQTVIERQAEHLTRLVDDLLDVTRIARGKIELRRSRVDLREVVSRAAEDFRMVLRDHAVAFDVVTPEMKLWADADPTRITQVVGNLLHNASKFTRKGDAVTLTLDVVGTVAEIRVRDTGVGIDSKLLPHVFEPFVQGQGTLARTEGGLGLGLALVKGITELHGGTVRVASAGTGRGTEFVVCVPVAAAPSLVEPKPGSGSSTGGLRVLIVEDNADSAESLAEIVRMLRHSADVAYDGPTALDKAQAHRPDLVLCDIGLPGMTGYEVARALRAMGSAGMQLVAVSGYTQPEDVRRAVEAGFDGHIAKPVDPGEIERLLAT